MKTSINKVYSEEQKQRDAKTHEIDTAESEKQ